MVQIVYMYMHRIGEEEAIIKTTLRFCACRVFCVVHSECTYVHVHVCGSARSGGGAHMKWTCHMEAHGNWK